VGDPDIVHHTYYSARFLGRTGRAKHVTTVCDMIPELFAGTEQFTATHLQKRQYVEECDLVICISESTRQDMVETYGDIARNVRVIPLAVQPGFGAGLPRLPDLPADYLLYVGARKGYKDFGLLASALERARSEGDVPPLVVVGKALTAEERDHLERHGSLASTIQVALGDDELKRAYSNCTALVQTSRYEGFGLTPLEGMASGAPVIVARSSSMPEVGGDVARYFEMGDADDLARALTEVLGDANLRENLRSRGLARAADFSVSKMAARTAAVYSELLNG
jgi:glycosyltransferase involved in cell wall biosynthesis